MKIGSTHTSLTIMVPVKTMHISTRLDIGMIIPILYTWMGMSSSTAVPGSVAVQANPVPWTQRR